MSTIKMTKNELRDQQHRLAQFERYLPTLQLKKAMLQLEVFNARLEIKERESAHQDCMAKVAAFQPLLGEVLAFDIKQSSVISQVVKHYENIAGVDIPLFDSVEFEEVDYQLFDTPAWVDGAILRLRDKAEAFVQVQIAKEKKDALEKELRDVSIRVNLFEKVLIPRSEGNIKKIRVFLGDQQLAAVGQAKVAKLKIIARKAAYSEERS